MIKGAYIITVLVEVLYTLKSSFRSSNQLKMFLEGKMIKVEISGGICRLLSIIFIQLVPGLTRAVKEIESISAKHLSIEIKNENKYRHKHY